jgi:23S rRNA (uridine2552-2'-O)-methyltransferase
MKKVQDPYFHKAKREGFAARSIYKLEQIDKKRRLLKNGMRVLDLGAAPGSWMQYAAARVGPGGRVVGVDLQPVTVSLPDHASAIEADVFSLTVESLAAEFCSQESGALFDLLLSDMAPKTTGIPSADAARSAELVLRCLELSEGLLAPGGALLAKIFQGSRLDEVRKAFAGAFAKVSLEKPKASRAESVEIFLLGLGKKE